MQAVMRLRGCGFQLPLRRPFVMLHSFASKHGAKRDNGMFQPTWQCSLCCNPANGRVDFDNVGL